MKIFRVVTEQDGETIKEPGKLTTELRREELRYAAETMQEVWKAIEWILNGEEKIVIAIIQEAPAVTVLTPNVAAVAENEKERYEHSQHNQIRA